MWIWLGDTSNQSRGESDSSPFDTNLESQSSNRLARSTCECERIFFLAYLKNLSYVRQVLLIKSNTLLMLCFTLFSTSDVSFNFHSSLTTILSNLRKISFKIRGSQLWYSLRRKLLTLKCIWVMAVILCQLFSLCFKECGMEQRRERRVLNAYSGLWCLFLQQVSQSCYRKGCLKRKRDPFVKV